MTSLRIALSSLAATLATAGLSTTAMAQADVTPVTFKPPFEGRFALYSEPGHVVNPGCDVGTSLVLDTGKLSGEFAVLEEFVSGLCKIFVAPDTRFATLIQTGTSCGSKFYAGTVRTDEGNRHIEITDHRGRVCRDLVPAKIIVKETFRGNERVLYSSYTPVSPR